MFTHCSNIHTRLPGCPDNIAEMLTMSISYQCYSIGSQQVEQRETTLAGTITGQNGQVAVIYRWSRTQVRLYIMIYQMLLCWIKCCPTSLKSHVFQQRWCHCVLSVFWTDSNLWCARMFDASHMTASRYSTQLYSRRVQMMRQFLQTYL